MRELAAAVDDLAATHGFSGVVRVDHGSVVEFAKAYGDAHRAHHVPNRLDTQFAIASGSKALTALAVVSLVADGVLGLATTARSVLGADLPDIAADVTVEDLLAHRSGIGDYLDESADAEPTDYVLAVPVHELATTEQFLAVLDGHPTRFARDERFEYNNGAYVVLALLAERASGVGFHELVAQRVIEPAGLCDTSFLRSDELPARAATGYLTDDESSRTNVLHLPVRGNGDGGAYTTAADVSVLWTSFFAARVVPATWVAEMVRPRSEATGHSMRYGLGFWLDPVDDRVMLEGADAGVSFRSIHDPATQSTLTVLSNTTDGAWPIARLLRGWPARV